MSSTARSRALACTFVQRPSRLGNARLLVATAMPAFLSGPQLRSEGSMRSRRPDGSMTANAAYQPRPAPTPLRRAVIRAGAALSCLKLRPVDLDHHGLVNRYELGVRQRCVGYRD